MPINFERRLTQEYFMNIIASLRSSAPNHKYDFKNYSLDNNDVRLLEPMAKKDGVGLYYNSIISFLQAIHSFQKSSISWGCVEIYYSLFYCLRSQLYLSDYVLIRDGGLYLVKIKERESPIKKNNKKYNTDHGGTINFFLDTFGDSDFMNSNNIDGVSYYEWINDLRETTNYRVKSFREPDTFSEIANTINIFNSIGVNSFLENISQDWGTYCFSSDYILISGVYRKIREVSKLYKKQEIKLSQDQNEYISSFKSKIGISKEIVNLFIEE
jgi:hypothetical protein